MPRLVSHIIEEHLLFVLSWCSQYLYERLLGKWQDEHLVGCHQIIDFTPLEQAYGGYHQGQGGKRGRPISHSVTKMVRVLYLMYQENCSYRQTESRLRRDLLWRWFAGYTLFDTVPDHNTIHQFDSYVRQQNPRLFFDTIVKQIDEAYPAERNRGQIGDTFAVLANAALEGPTHRLRHLCSHLLQALDTCSSDAYEEVVAKVDEGQLFGWAEQTAWTDDPAKRQIRRQEAVLAAVACREFMRPYEATDERVEKAALYIDKMITDEFRLTYDGQGCLVAATLLPSEQRGAFRICSATDPEATYRTHGADKKDYGFNGAVAATDKGLIREIEVHTGSCGDTTTIPGLLSAQKEHHALLPPTFSFDQIAGTGKTAADVHEVSGGATKLIATPKLNHKKKDTFTIKDCHLSADGLTLTCPNGRTSRRKYRSGSGKGHNFRFLAAQCLGCPLLKQCRDSEKTPTTPRNFFLSAYMPFMLALLADSQTEEFRRHMKKRPRIELVIAHLVLFHGARHARFRGIAKVDYQLKMAAMTYNVKWWLKHRKREGQSKLAPREKCVC